jgi:hypothetical protein
MRKIITIFSLFFFCSCSHFVQDSKDVVGQAKEDATTIKENSANAVVRVATQLRDNVKLTNEHLRDWLITPLPKKENLPVPQRYCYRVLQDILCYREQMVGWENKLVGYQGTNAAPPVFVATKPLPLRTTDTSTTSVATRISASKPVFSEVPNDIKDTKNAAGDVVSVDGAHETLPDSPLAPQL